MVTVKQEKYTRRIEEILRMLGSELAEKIASIKDVKELDRNIREIIVDVLGNEFCEKGLGPDSEPNDYGLEIEELIDACGL